MSIKKIVTYAFVLSTIAALLISSMSISLSIAQMADGLIPHYFGPYPNYATSQLPTVDPITGAVSGGIRKFVDSLPLLGPSGKNNLNQYLSVAVPDKTTYPGADYYEIAVVEFEQQMHSDLAPTKLRGYVQLDTAAIPGAGVPLTNIDGTPILMPDGTTQAIGVDIPRYLGPFIVADKGVPVRIKFYNLLPTGMGGDLFIPVDTTVMGSGMGPIAHPGMPGMMYSYTQNRATLHLHGGRTPWISDGTAHQWITPAGETTVYPEGVSVYNVPDMPDPGPGAMTFYYTNDQSARLMFYHDHSYGITRLNVYAGEAAGYVLRDDVEKALIAAGIIPADEIPLVIQDKTFVPDNTVPITNMWGTFASQLAFQDPTWDTMKWGEPGDLWYPHVYMTMQNPSDPSGMNTFGRWQYGPWFWPPTVVEQGPKANPYAPGGSMYDAAYPYNDLEPAQIPGVPNVSMPGEAFMDTPVVNGVAYPYLEVDPKAYRFRILNAADDRFFNLQLYLADPAVITADGRTNTEVKMVPAIATPGFPAEWPTDGREGGVPDPTTRGPQFIQIGNEAGFLPAPAVLPTLPVNWNMDQGTFDFGLVNQYTLMLGTAERADVIVDFSGYAGQTIILYNDCPAPVPASDPRQDYYTGKPDQTDSGGSPTILPGFGSNTRTIMQIRVRPTTPAPTFNIPALEAAFAGPNGAFVQSQGNILVPQTAYSSAYGTTLPNIYSQIFSNSLTFTPIGSSTPITIPFQPKTIQDEMGEAFDPVYGRMAVLLGVELPKTQALQQTMLLYNYADPPTEVVKATDITTTQIGQLNDGTQIWKITHNGVDVHTVHWHMFEVQLINRVAWDNNIRMPDANELGWKETIRVNPLQDTIVALRPVILDLPFDLPNSVRLIDPTMPAGVTLKTTNIFDPSGQPITLTNHVVNFGWEYVWHCHILAHEEMDMMRAIIVAAPPRAPTNLVVTTKGTSATLTWTDNSASETSFTIERADDAAFAVGLTKFTVNAGTTTYTDKIKNKQLYFYRVKATNTVGDTTQYPQPAIGFPTMSVDSAPSNIAMTDAPPAAPTNLASTHALGSSVVQLSWNDNSGNEQGFLIQRSTSSNFNQNVASWPVSANVKTYVDGSIVLGTRYYYRVRAFNAFGNSAWSNVETLIPL